MDTSASLLTDLATFLSTFQHDLSAVSGHISELQGRSKSIEARLASRRAVEKALDPFLKEIVLQPKLIDLVLETDVGLDWVEPIKDLSLKILAIRSGPRVAARKNLDEAAEALRVKVRLSLSSRLPKPWLNLMRTSLGFTEDYFALSFPLTTVRHFSRFPSPRFTHTMLTPAQAPVRLFMATLT